MEEVEEQQEQAGESLVSNCKTREFKAKLG